MKTIQLIPIEFIHQVWEKHGNFIEEAMAHAKGECTAEQLKALLVIGNHSLLAFMEDSEIVALVEFHFNTSPNARIFFINALGGKTSEEHMELMYNFAKQHGATHIRYACRESVARLSIMRYGFNKIYETVERKL